MEIRVKTGDNLKCSYTQKPSKVLVKIAGEDLVEGDFKDAPNPGPTTAWMGRDALESALRMLNSAEGVPPVVASSNIMHYPPGARGVEIEGDRYDNVAATTIAVKDSPQVVKAFQTELNGLIENPPKSRENEKDGLSETTVKELIKRHLPSFRNPSGFMFPILNQSLGMPKERFNHIVEILKS